MTCYRVLLPNTKSFKKQLVEISRDNKIVIAKRGMTNSFYVPSVNTKFVDRSFTKPVENPLSDKMEDLLPSEYARLWLKKLYPPFCVPSSYNHLRQSPPNWFSGQFINRDLVYFDLVGAYYQLYSKLWLDFTDFGKRCKYPLSEIAKKLEHWKAARNSLVGNLASKEACVIKGNDFSYIPTWGKSKYYNHLILYYLNRLLTELANIALSLGCCYIATDGFIFPVENSWKKFINILEKYNLRFRCTIGLGNIYRFASYQIDGMALYGDKNYVSTPTFEKSFRSYINNPLFVNDSRKTQLLKKFTLPLKHVDRMSSYDTLDRWSKLA